MHFSQTNCAFGVKLHLKDYKLSLFSILRLLVKFEYERIEFMLNKVRKVKIRVILNKVDFQRAIEIIY